MTVDIVSALCRCMDSLFNISTTPAMAETALDGVSIIVQSGFVAGPDQDRGVPSLAGVADDGENLGLAHCLAHALETELEIGHSHAVGVIMPRVLLFNAPVAGDMMPRLASALGLEAQDQSPEQSAIEIEAVIFKLYEKIGVPRFFDPHEFDPGLIPDMAMAAGRGLYGEGYLETPPTGQTLIPSPNRRRATIREAEGLYEQCFA